MDTNKSCTIHFGDSINGCMVVEMKKVHKCKFSGYHLMASTANFSYKDVAYRQCKDCKKVRLTFDPLVIIGARK